MTAFALYKPAIASNVGAFSEQIENGKNGFLVAPCNAEDLAKKINECLSSDLYLKMGENLKTQGLTNPWEKNWPLLENAYLENIIHN
jgi:glycosyltransferase involved in cell wall biosynthesis